MTKSHRRRARSPVTGFRSAIMQKLAAALKRPVRSLLFALLNAVLVWLVLTKSLPYALAPSAPDNALALNPNNPDALIAKAAILRERLISIMTPGQGQTQTARTAADAAEKSGDTIAALPAAGLQTGMTAETEGEREALRKEIRKLAAKAIANDPLNARAFRFLAEVTDEADKTRSLMLESFRRSRRESSAVFWLLNDSFYRKDFAAALDYADVLLRTRPELSEPVFNYLAKISRDPGGRTVLVQQLLGDPPWRRLFLEKLPAFMTAGGAAIEISAALKSGGKPATGKDLAPLLAHLIRANRADDAYNVWLQSLLQAQAESLGLLTNPAFESDPSGSPFDWTMRRGVNAIAEFTPGSGMGNKRFLHISFSDGARVRFPEVSQVLILSPGRYRLEGVLRGTITAKRGLRWQLRCATAPDVVLGETEMLMGQSAQWRVFSLQAEVSPNVCVGQLLRLYHDARSASEEFISGEVWFSGLHLDRMRAAAENSASPGH